MNLPSNTPSGNNQVISDIDMFINNLSAADQPDRPALPFTLAAQKPAPVPVEVTVPQTDEEVQRFVLENAAKLVASGINSIDSIREIIGASYDAELIASLAGLMASTTSTIETINKINLQNKKNTSNKEVKQIEIEGKKELQRLKNEGSSSTPAGTILVATREEILRSIATQLKIKPEDSIIEVETTPEPDKVPVVIDAKS